MKLPTIEEINELHRKHAPSKEALDSVLTHCQIVSIIALQIADDNQNVDTQLVEVGALLHDIGVYKLYNGSEVDKSLNYITHGLRGYELLKEEGYDEVICRFALLHTGVGITAEDVKQQNLPLPERDYVAETAEERIVMYADKFHSKSAPPTFNSPEWFREHLEKFGADKISSFDELVDEFGIPDLKPLMARYGQNIR